MEIMKIIRIERRIEDFSKRKIDDTILYYLLEYRFFDIEEGSFESPQEKAQRVLSNLVNSDVNSNRYSDTRTSNYVGKQAFKYFDKIKTSYKEREEKARNRNRANVQGWIDKNPDWFSQYESYIGKKHSTYKRNNEWKRVQRDLEYDDAVTFDKFKKFKTEISDLDKLKRRNKIVAKLIGFTKGLMKVLLGLLVLIGVSWLVYLLTLISTSGWIMTGVISGGVITVCGIGFGLFLGIRYLIRDTKLSEYFESFFKGVWELTKIIFLPITFIVKMFGRRISMLLDWKKENCPQINYEGFDD